jgi:hypothetical protein
MPEAEALIILLKKPSLIGKKQTIDDGLRVAKFITGWALSLYWVYPGVMWHFFGILVS